MGDEPVNDESFEMSLNQNIDNFEHVEFTSSDPPQNNMEIEDWVENYSIKNWENFSVNNLFVSNVDIPADITHSQFNSENNAATSLKEPSFRLKGTSINLGTSQNFKSFTSQTSMAESFNDEPLEETKSDKKSPNKKRNLPGLIAQRVRTSCRTYIESMLRNQVSERRLDYIGDVLGKYHLGDAIYLEKFDNYLKSWDFTRKTWKNIKDNLLEKNKLYGRVFLTCIERFLLPEGEEDYENWLEFGKLRSSKILMIEFKDHIREKFTEKFSRLVQ